jgi:surface polysaccharide O-acyltransferase-like enzyme
MSVGWFLGVYPGTRLVSLWQWLPFVGYYLAGHYLHTYPFAWPTKKIILALGSLIILAALGTYQLTSTYGHGPRGVLLQDYLSPVVIVVAILAFTLFTRLQALKIPAWLQKVIKELAYTSFGIYLVHLLVMESLGKLLMPVLHTLPAIVANAALIISTVVISYVLVRLLSFVPLIKKTIGL